MSMMIPNAQDTLDSAKKNNIIPDQEFLLQGSVMDTSVSVLLDRLKGLCDMADCPTETFHDHEVVFILKDFNVTAMMTPGLQSQGVILRVRRDIERPELPWQLRYTGQPEIGNRPALLRNCLDISVSSNVCEWLTELGAKVDHEFVAKGYILKKGRIKVSVFKMFKMIQGISKDNLEPMSMSHLVEVSVVTTRTDEAVADDLRNFADQLRPLVQLEKINYQLPTV